MNILITGGAGFIGFHLARSLAFENKFKIVLIDNLNDYYDVSLKHSRLKELGIEIGDITMVSLEIKSKCFDKLSFYHQDINEIQTLSQIFSCHRFQIVIHLAAQAGVRYSIEKPRSYLATNVNGFFNVLDLSREFKVDHFVFASSSSVYGRNEKVPYSETDMTDRPFSIYAATKKSNELMAHVYSEMFSMKITGLRFFTVYGPWGRPDMLYFLATDCILKGKPIPVFNYGSMKRDFTFIDDILSGIKLIVNDTSISSRSLFNVYNIGNNKSVPLLDFLEILSVVIGKRAIMDFKSMQSGDVVETFADINRIQTDYGYNPSTELRSGLSNFYQWYKEYYSLV